MRTTEDLSVMGLLEAYVRQWTDNADIFNPVEGQAILTNAVQKPVSRMSKG